MTVIEQQEFQSFTLHSHATVDGNGNQATVGAYNGAQMIEVVNSGAGSCQVNIEGSFDGLNWYAVGYQQVDNVASLSRTTAVVSVLGTSSHVYQALDLYAQLRARISGTTGVTGVTIKLFAVAV